MSLHDINNVARIFASFDTEGDVNAYVGIKSPTAESVSSLLSVRGQDVREIPKNVGVQLFGSIDNFYIHEAHVRIRKDDNYPESLWRGQIYAQMHLFCSDTSKEWEICSAILNFEDSDSGYIFTLESTDLKRFDKLTVRKGSSFKEYRLTPMQSERLTSRRDVINAVKWFEFWKGRSFLIQTP